MVLVIERDNVIGIISSIRGIIYVSLFIILELLMRVKEGLESSSLRLKILSVTLLNHLSFI
jgi:hypothetical protein